MQNRDYIMNVNILFMTSSVLLIALISSNCLRRYKVKQIPIECKLEGSNNN